MRIKTLDMTKVDGYAVDEIDVVISDLQKKRRYQPDLLYRGFNGDNIEKLVREGQDTDFPLLHCATEDQVRTGSEGNVFEHALDHPTPALAVFDPTYVEKFYEFAYTFNDPRNKQKALVAVYRLRYD